MKQTMNKFNWKTQSGETIAELKNHALVFDTAQKEDIYFGQEGNLKKSDNFKMVVNQRTSRDIVAVSNEYNLLQHKDVINSVADALTNLNIQGTCKSTGYGNRVFVDICFPSVKFDIRQGEQFIGGMRIINSYDTTTGIMVLPQLMRVACNNGMVLSSVWVDSINIRHTSKLVHEFEAHVPRLIESMVKGCPAFAEMVENSIKDSVEWEIMEQILPSIIKQEKYRKLIAERLIADHQDGSKYTRWELYNAITNLCSHRDQLRPTIENSMQNIAEKLLVTPLLTVQPNSI